MISRMSPMQLRGNSEIFHRFRGLMLKHVNFVSSFKKVPRDTVKCYHRKKSAAKARHDEIDEYIRSFEDGNIKFVISEACDYKKVGNAEPTSADGEPAVVKYLDAKCRESKRLLFFEGALFEATSNVIGQYYNSQILIMLDVPSEEDVRLKKPIKLYAAPAGSKRPAKKIYDPPPSRDEVLNVWGWKEVSLGPPPESFHKGANFWAYRKQYSLVHVGNTTVCGIWIICKLHCF